MRQNFGKSDYCLDFTSFPKKISNMIAILRLVNTEQVFKCII